MVLEVSLTYGIVAVVSVTSTRVSSVSLVSTSRLMLRLIKSKTVQENRARYLISSYKLICVPKSSLAQLVKVSTLVARFEVGLWDEFVQLRLGVRQFLYTAHYYHQLSFIKEKNIVFSNQLFVQPFFIGYLSSLKSNLFPKDLPRSRFPGQTFVFLG